MRFLAILTLVVVGAAVMACGSPAPPQQPPSQAPLVVPTVAPVVPTPTVAGVVTATAEPPGPTPAPTMVAQSVASATAPAATEIPAAPVEPDSKLVGTYSGVLPAADAIGRVVTLDLALDGTATMTTQFIGKGEPSIESGTWVGDGDNAVVTFTLLDGQPQDNRITWTLQGTNLVSTEHDESQYGTEGLPLTRVGTGEIVETNFGGVSFSFDSSLAKSAQGKYLAPVPVEQAPALGGGAPEGIQFLFDTLTPPADYFAPQFPQVYVYPVEGLKALDPSVAEGVTALETILQAGTLDPSQNIFVFPLIPASQAFRAQEKLLDFVNGKGVSFITYYAQDVAPLRPQQVFWTFQGITLDGKYYISAFWNIGSPALPEERNISGAEYDAFAKEYENYINDLVTVLNALPPAAFNPNLSLLENMARSFNVVPTFPTPTPGAGDGATPAAATPEAEGTPSASAQTEATPVAAAVPQAVPPAQPMTAAYGGVSFEFASSLAEAAEGFTIPETPVDQNQPGGLAMGGPEHVAFAFDGATIGPETNPFQSQIRVYPANQLKALDPSIAQEIIALKTLLSVDHTALQESVPVLPPFNAQQMIHPQIKYLNFKDGEGVRFVTSYAQNPAPITNDGLFYTFQGLTTDGEKYITAFWNLKTDALPDTIADANIGNMDEWVKKFEGYLTETAAKLNELPSDGFSPDLAALDAMMASLDVQN